MSQVVDLADSVAAPAPPAPGMVEAAFLPVTSAVTLGLVGARADAFVLGPFELLRFGPPERLDDGVRWPIAGGLLVAAPGGHVGFEWRSGRLTGFLRGYRPAIPPPVYALLQRPIHHLVTRLFLLHVRGRDPLPAPEATRRARNLAAALDAGFCLGVTRCRPRRALVFGLAYHVACWAGGGRTLGGWAMGIRVRSVDGSPLTPGQAAARLLGDRFAGTAVVEDR